jgi:cyanate permease
MMALSICYGLTVGNVTTLAPIVVRREFGAASFGAVFGASATMTQVAMALGPSVFGGIRQAWGSYAPALVLGAMLNLVAAAALVWGGRRPLVRS